jgi:hypothetical protein
MIAGVFLAALQKELDIGYGLGGEYQVLTRGSK